jgi:hypothetical protein
MRDTEITTKVLYHPEKAYFLGQVVATRVRVFEAPAMCSNFRKLGFTVHREYLSREERHNGEQVHRADADYAEIYCQIRLITGSPDTAKNLLFEVMDRWHKLMTKPTADRQGWIEMD